MLIIIVALVIIVGISVYIINNNSKKGEYNNSDVKTTEDLKEHESLIDMKNTENVKIKDGEKVNTSEKLTKDKEFSGLKVTDIKLQTKKGVSNFTATIENSSKEEYKGGIVTLTFKKSDGTDLAKVEAMIPAIKAGEKNTINASTTADVVNASNVEIN